MYHTQRNPGQGEVGIKECAEELTPEEAEVTGGPSMANDTDRWNSNSGKRALLKTKDSKTKQIKII